MFKLLNIELLLIFSCFITTVFIVWFKTNAVVEYGKLIGLKNLLWIEEYEKYVCDNLEGDYVTFLACKHNTFLTRLITCPLCLGVWYSIIASLPLGLVHFCPIYLLSLFMYFTIVKIGDL
jgi:hypothetical protein